MTTTGIHPDNQVPELKDYNVYTSDPTLRGAVTRGGAAWRDEELARQGAEYGAEATLRAAEDANHHEPELHTHSRTGERIDQVRFHPAWHTMMTIARRNGIANLPFFDERPSAWVGYGASLYMHSQIESGSTCPTTMTKACIPVVRRNAALYAALRDKLASNDHDARDIPLEGKTSITVGMGMTEKQGGSDVRTNTTRAVPAGSGPWGDEFLITGHKWFFSAPMCDGHLVLAKTDEHGSSCFFVPRWRPDGSKNAIHIQRLKDKVGNRSNSSSEVEFKDAWGVLVGDEGRGIPTIIEMATVTRLDCALASAGFMRQAFAQALHYARNRHVFGKALADQPVMTALLADMALESQSATLLAMGLASRFGSAAPLDTAWRRLLTPAAKFWNCKRAVALTGEAMEVFGGNGYVEEGPMGRLFREAPVNSIWEGSGNVMCLDVLRAVSRNPDDAHLVLDHLQEVATGEPRVLDALQTVRRMTQLPPQELEQQARRFIQRLVLAAQACLMLEHASAEESAAFLSSRFDPDWGPVTGISAGTSDPAALLRAAWR
ncbi:acyl-CoA dehydrogenase family protein [Variovorax sp. NFACC27]|uniref:acyl-CoA dehydrogenase family protein n=1 Tax=unclassified Variovorax TaxID=663243 RepID=UPI00089D6DA2|nr:putative acyl-CoA dehydrogenase [Variovorax sp. NFACC28]SEG00835.1 putative acyl-CoA dehydrogenase [Variovorax sp. NFACC29]SFB95987.1 putative acyl-CoA dehydrogenase [Variovorax sp. NFACC26]SFF80755.1 putative acyl-CoA dehydrogenase [Variovorax sp. NFACC27]